MGIHFVTFGSIDYARQVHRISDEARITGWFSTVRGMFPPDLSPEFLRNHRDFMRGRGYGYWVWKPQVVLQSLEILGDDDILVYADSGCTINVKGEPRFREYIQMVQEHPSGILAFQMHDQTERAWTKREVFEKMGYTFFNSLQLCATYLIVRKCDASMNLIREWSMLTQQRDLINDRRWLGQHFEFRDHRHDQSIWSILVKKSGACIVPTDEGFPPGRPEFPLWGSRIRGDTPSPYNK